MTNLLLVFKATFLSIFSVNKKSKNQRKAFVGMIFIGIALLVFSSIYSFILLYNYKIEGLESSDYLLTLMAVATILTFGICITQMQGSFYSTQDYEFLQSLPIKKHDIVLGKMLSIYLINFAEDFLIVFPGVLIYLIMGGKTSIFLYSLFAILFLSFIPIGLSSLFATLIALFASFFKKRNILMVLAYFLLFLAIFGASFFFSFATNTQSTAMINAVGNILPYMALLKLAYTSSFLYFIYFVLIHIVVAIFAIILISFCYQRINSRMNSNFEHEKYVSKNEEKEYANVRKTLEHKEFQSIIKNPMYLINSYIGPFVWLVISIFIFVFSRFMANDNFESQNEALLFYSTMCSTAIGMGLLMNSIATSTSASFSLEGKNLELLFSYPIEGKEIIKAKLRVAIFVPAIMNLFVSIVLILLISILYGFDTALALQLLLFPQLACFAYAYVGLFCGLKWVKTDYENPAQVFKNSAAVNWGMLFFSLPSFLLMIIVIVMNLLSTMFGLPLLRYFALLPPLIGYGLVILISMDKIKNKGNLYFERLKAKLK